jgi:hypothetical protein
MRGRVEHAKIDRQCNVRINKAGGFLLPTQHGVRGLLPKKKREKFALIMFRERKKESWSATRNHDEHVKGLPDDETQTE